MTYGLYVSAAGARAQSQRMEVLANNLSNVDTPGFKRELAVLQARHSEAIERGEDLPGTGSINDVGGGMAMRQTVTDFSQGTLKRTGVPTDLAINHAEGFFLVEKDGEQFLTRAGNFRLDSQGALLTDHGWSVLGENGEPIVINGSLHRVSRGGVLDHDGGSVAIAIVNPGSLQDLSKVGETLFRPRGPVSLVPLTERHVESGYLEQSAVSPTLAMMELIEGSRAYETNIRMIQNQDHVLGTLVNRILRQS